MKAVVYTEYGGPEVLRLEEVERPTPKQKEVLVRVAAVSINKSDWEFLTATPAYVRAWGLRRPTFPILGSDIAGTVEATGPGATRFKEGDPVFGDLLYRWGGFAEYARAPEESLSLKPPTISFEIAAALPEAGLVALQGLRVGGEIQAGERVAINGAGGGAGSFAVQIAKFAGAEVTGIDSTEKLEFLRTLGADYVVDYTREDFTKNVERYDRILDLYASHSLTDYRRSLRPGGRYVMVGGTVPQVLRTALLGPVRSIIGTKKTGMLAYTPNESMSELVTLVERGNVNPVIERHYQLEEVGEALRHVGEGRAKGKIVVRVVAGTADRAS
jgi:NADPH:quinone reductase-like Zn-dependent oxidoreductase